jgi:hypothetical protein
MGYPRGYPIILKQLYAIILFLGAAVEEKTAAQKKKNSLNFGYPQQFYFKYLSNYNS